jgi:hypothetical protein
VLARVSDQAVATDPAAHAWCALQAAIVFDDPVWLAQAETLLDEAPVEDWRTHAVAVAVARARSDAPRERRAADGLVRCGGVPGVDEAAARLAARDLVRALPFTLGSDVLRPWLEASASPSAMSEQRRRGGLARVWDALERHRSTGAPAMLASARHALRRASRRAPELDIAAAWFALQQPESFVRSPFAQGLTTGQSSPSAAVSTRRTISSGSTGFARC